jgi:Uma2 family endonuclease
MKYEYHAGRIRMMSGGSREHATIAGNIFVELRLQFRSGPCTVYNSDMRVQVTQDTCYFPDVTVTCDVNDRRHGITIVESPRLVVEVLSPSTEKTDRVEKLANYQACPSVAEIVFASQFAPYVEVWRRDMHDEATWRYAHYSSGQEVEFISLDVHMPIEDIYRDINFDEPLTEEI